MIILRDIIIIFIIIILIYFIYNNLYYFIPKIIEPFDFNNMASNVDFNINLNKNLQCETLLTELKKIKIKQLELTNQIQLLQKKY